eukprot:3876490-Rhodomonas_salina.1
MEMWHAPGLTGRCCRVRIFAQVAPDGLGPWRYLKFRAFGIRGRVGRCLWDVGALRLFQLDGGQCRTMSLSLSLSLSLIDTVILAKGCAGMTRAFKLRVLIRG